MVYFTSSPLLMQRIRDIECKTALAMIASCSFGPEKDANIGVKVCCPCNKPVRWHV